MGCNVIEFINGLADGDDDGHDEYNIICKLVGCVELTYVVDRIDGDTVGIGSNVGRLVGKEDDVYVGVNVDRYIGVCVGKKVGIFDGRLVGKIADVSVRVMSLNMHQRV